MEFTGIKAAGRSGLIRYAAAIADNGSSMLADAELMLSNGRNARAYALGALAIEEFGKAVGVVTLAVMPDHLRNQVPLDKILQWHRMKQTAGLILAMLQPGVAPGVAATIDGTPRDQLARILETMDTEAQATERMKERGFYADMEADGTIWHPAQITGTEATAQVARAKEVAASAGMFKDDDAMDRLANPPGEALAVSTKMFEWYFQATQPMAADAAAQAAKDGLEVALAQMGRVVAAQLTQEPPAT